MIKFKKKKALWIWDIEYDMKEPEINTSAEFSSKLIVRVLFLISSIVL